MTVGEVDPALANRARADQDLERVGRADQIVLQEIGHGESEACVCAVLSSVHSM